MEDQIEATETLVRHRLLHSCELCKMLILY